MHHTRGVMHTQQRFVVTARAASDCQSTFNLLTGEVLFDEIENTCRRIGKGAFLRPKRWRCSSPRHSARTGPANLR